jgi:hypothetical protein
MVCTRSITSDGIAPLRCTVTGLPAENSCSVVICSPFSGVFWTTMFGATTTPTCFMMPRAFGRVKISPVRISVIGFIILFLFHQMTEQESHGKYYPGTNQNILECVSNFWTTRSFVKLFKQSVLIRTRNSLTPLPLTNGDRVNSGKLSELDLVETKLIA